MAGDRVAPNPGKSEGDKKVIGLPRAAPLVQPNKPAPASPSSTPKQEGKRSRVSADGGSERKSIGGGGLAAPSSTRNRGPSITSKFGEVDENGFRSTEQESRLDAYAKLAAEKCEQAVEASTRRAEERRSARRPKHVWWGFHYFWPEEALAGKKEDDPMDDVHFLKRVAKLMQNDRVVETFSIFDKDGSGSIDAKELRPVVTMVLPNYDPALIDEMVEQLDINRDGEVDLWEFCIAIQKRTEGISEADMRMEVDEAFNHCFNPDEVTDLTSVSVGEREMRRAMQACGKKLSEAEFETLLKDFDVQGIPIRNGAKITLAQLRKHPAFA
mmetsp:Transcript_2014/g.5671  ORF Transcript_2014/g.5671 Transcript_2014/m.5671 type:complete len:327 (-) Transcript_2014:738-1718(-)